MQPITLYILAYGPNPWKPAIILEELNLPYTLKPVPKAEVKDEPFISVNPNGRVPAIEDPNTGITIWESGAIMEYLIETYDKDHTISFERGSEEYFHAKQYLHFQMSGQGPYFGQAVWFVTFHPEKIPSAQERYLNEVKRVTGVLEKVLEGKEYLVGGKFSYADAAFVPWYGIVPTYTAGTFDLEKEFPNVKAWLDRLRARPTVAKVFKDREEAMAAETAAAAKKE
ncbi:glutathione S-transferase family protein [Aspergillus lucknowensis]|uniref:Glutathione S-transferase n=1 Tax=Aspergillus lucknowensis TaxID=176173 RepID=A0ABR4LCX3_9EURO